MATHSLDNTCCVLSIRVKPKRLELCFWLFLLVICNHPLLSGQVAGQYVFVPELVMNGQWYRAILSPFTHVSWYHLTLDAAAFVLLWNGLEEKRCWGRWTYLLGCWVGSLAVPLVLTSQVYERGLCGLSGIAHGLLAITALEMLIYKDSKESRTLGGLLFVGLLTKVFWEVASGGGVMSNLHLGDVGVPIVTSHLGGLIGGCVAFSLLHLRCRDNRYMWRHVRSDR